MVTLQQLSKYCPDNIKEGSRHKYTPLGRESYFLYKAF